MTRLCSSLCRIGGIVFFSVLSAGQTTVDLRTQSKNVDFSNAPSTRPAKTGTALPATCNVGEAFFNTAAAAGNNLYGCAATNVWALEGGSGGGSSSLPAMAVSANGTLLSIGATCSTASPCNVRIGSTVYSFTNGASATISSGSGTAFVYVDSNGTLTVGHNFGIGSVTCTGPCAALNGITAFPPDSIPIWTWTATAGTWTSTGGTDERAFLSEKVVVCGANLQCANSGSVLTISSSSTSSGGGLTAPLVDFSDHSSIATGAAQTLATLNLPAGAMSATSQYAVLAISGVQATSGNSISLRFGNTAILIGNGVSNWGLAGGTAFTVECKVIRTASNAQKISCVSGIAQNVAGPYINITTGSEDLTASVLITMQATTNGNAGDVVLKTFEFRPVNF